MSYPNVTPDGYYLEKGKTITVSSSNSPQTMHHFSSNFSLGSIFYAGPGVTASGGETSTYADIRLTSAPISMTVPGDGYSSEKTIPAGYYMFLADDKDDTYQWTWYAVTQCTIRGYGYKDDDTNPYNKCIELVSGTADVVYAYKNKSPASPSRITIPETIRGGEDISISWSTATDPDGKIGGYELERQWDGTGSWTQIYKGSKTTYSDPIPQGEHTSVTYRVRAYDEYDTYSSYTTSATRTIINNAAPTTPEWCSVPNPVKGGTSIKITWPASTDSDGNLSGYILERKFNSNSWTRIYKGANRSYTDPIPLDKYKTVTYRVKAYDTKNAQSAYATSATRTIQNSTVLKFRLKTPIESSKRARYGQEIMTYTIPSGAIFKAEACNNGFDENPTWEDVTEFVKKQKIFEFANKTKTASKWGYDIRVTVDRNGATGNCYFTRGNGFFEEEE